MRIRQILLYVVALLISPALFAQTSAPPQATPPQATPTPVADSPEVTKLRADLDWARKTLADWPNLGRYRDANAQVAPPAKNEERVVFMGDSITDGWGRHYGTFFPGKPYVNRGISGQTTPQMVIRFRPDVIALQPKAVVILAGTNDIAGNTGPMTLGQIEGNLASMAELSKANRVHVVLASVLPVSNYGHDRQGNPLDMRTNRPPEKILELNAWIKKYAAQNGHTYLDYFSAMVDPQGMLQKDLSEDGLHPNAKGYAVMSPLVEQAIRSALKKRH